ncbi:MAG: extracellular solute-binding protein, partial [Deltaproteobacteria bacterium]|nr:extracellular solute-binding protein [Deltaproteobacteria bacterium]
MRRYILFAFLFCCFLANGSNGFAAKNVSKEVVVYTSIDDIFARPITKRFEQKTGIHVKLVPDTEETKSTGLLNRLIAEKNRPQADVFWSGDPVRAGILKEKGVAQSYKSPSSAGLPHEYSDPEGYWIGFSARARVLLYNANLIPKGSEPTSVMDLLNPRFKGKACMANPLFGTTSMHAAALFEVLGDKKAREFFDGLIINGVKMLSSNGEVRRRVAAGDFALGFVDSDDAHEVIRDHKPVGVVYADEKGIGTLIIPNAAVLIRNGPSPDAGRAFIDYLVSAEAEQALAESDAAQIPLRASVKVSAIVRPLSQIHSMHVDYNKLGTILDQISRGFLREWVAKNKQ